MHTTTTEATERPAVVDGRFRVESLVGRGAFGEVHRARDIRTGEAVALKFFSASSGQDGYLRELGMLFSEQHPNIVPTVSFGYVRGSKYLVYAFMEGGNLRDLLRRRVRLPAHQALQIARDIVDGLAFAHERRIVHRDLKPENVLLESTEWPCRVRLCDFGLAMRHRDSDEERTPYGSPAYMAPEQFGDSYDERVDFYALGVILYEMLFGRRPFQGDITSLRYAHQHREVELPERGPAPLWSLLRDLLAKDPEDRPAEVGLLRSRLDAVLQELRSAGSTLVTPPEAHRSEVAFSGEWTARAGGKLHRFATTRDGSLLLEFPNFLTSLDPDGHFETIARTEHRSDALADGGRRDGTIAWLSGGQLWWSRGGSRRHLPVEEAAGEGAVRALVSPDGAHVLLLCPGRLALVSLEEGVRWRAEVSSYGEFPEACFSGDGTRIWVAAESPRTQLMGITLDGDKFCRTSLSGGEVMLQPAGERGVIVAARSRRQISRLDERGFVTATCDTAESIVELDSLALAHDELRAPQTRDSHRFSSYADALDDARNVGSDDTSTEPCLTVCGSRYIELLEVDELTSRALVMRPSSQHICAFGAGGVYLLEPGAETCEISRRTITRRQQEPN